MKSICGSRRSDPHFVFLEKLKIYHFYFREKLSRYEKLLGLKERGESRGKINEQKYPKK